MKYLMPEERKNLPIDVFGYPNDRSFPITDLSHAIMAVLLFHEIPVHCRPRAANLINRIFEREDFYVDKSTVAITFRPYAVVPPPGKLVIHSLRGYDELFDVQYYIDGMSDIVLVNGMVSREEDQIVIADFLSRVAEYVCDSWYMRLPSHEKPTLLDDMEILDLLAIKDLFHPTHENTFVSWTSADGSFRSEEKLRRVRDKRRVHEVLRAGLDLIEDRIKDVNVQDKMRGIFNTYARLLGFPNIQMSKKELDAFVGDTTLGVLMDLAPYDNGDIRPSMYRIEDGRTYGTETFEQTLQHVYGDILYLTRRAVKACVKSKRFEDAGYYTDDQYPIAGQAVELRCIADVFSRVMDGHISPVYLLKRDGAPTIPLVIHKNTLYSVIGKMTSGKADGVYTVKYLLARLCGDETRTFPIGENIENVVRCLKSEMSQMDSIFHRKIKIRLIVAKMNDEYYQAQSELVFQNIMMNARTGDVYLHHMSDATSFEARVYNINKEFKIVSQGKDIAAAKELACELLTMRCEQYLCDPQLNPAWSEEISKMIGRRDVSVIDRNQIEILFCTIVDFVRMYEPGFNLFQYYMDAGYNKVFYSIQQVPPLVIRRLANVIKPTVPRYRPV